ncbi:hypothetical protein G6011_02577 [Alternaria panax]|uniref:Uncharacterized protein n=1 Tax=Alternaria panax TaxID=48097 RepID=A0AAD4FAG6_9PLEO|nr:hypothetical protein G6011_02577 [Alternaria panax]
MKMTNADCEALDAELEAIALSGYRNPDGSKRKTRDPASDDRVSARMDEALADVDWIRNRCNQSRQHRQPSTVKDIIKCINEADFLSEHSRTTLCNMMDSGLHYHFDIGMHRNYHYCLKSDLISLDPLDHDVDWDDKREMMPESILGINMSRIEAWTDDRRKNNSSDESSSSNSSSVTLAEVARGR